MEPTNEETSLFTGVVIKNIPEALPKKDIEDLLAKSGVEDVAAKIKITTNNGKSTAEVTNLESEICCKVIEDLNETKVGENKIYCRGFSDLTSPTSQEIVIEGANADNNEPNASEDKKKEHVEDDKSAKTVIDSNKKPKPIAKPIEDSPKLSQNQQNELKKKLS